MYFVFEQTLSHWLQRVASEKRCLMKHKFLFEYLSGLFVDVSFEISLCYKKLLPSSRV